MAGGEMVHGGDAQRRREGHNDYDDMESEEEKELGPYEIFEIYRREWVDSKGKGDAYFYEPSDLLPMRHTDGPMLPVYVKPRDMLEVFFVKVARLAGGLRWPLEVYGDVAVRDSLDRMRNYLFRRDRNNCQTLTSPQDSLLELTGPRRALILLDKPVFEIDLKVKATGTSSSSEDNLLCLDFFGYSNIAYQGTTSYAMTKVASGGNCTMEFRLAHMKRSVEATVTALITTGSRSFSARLTANALSVGEDVVLLDTRGREVTVSDDGEVTLQRRVVVAEDQGELILGMEAKQLGSGSADESAPVVQRLSYTVRSALRSEAYFVIGETRMRMLIAWSMLP